MRVVPLCFPRKHQTHRAFGGFTEVEAAGKLFSGWLGTVSPGWKLYLPASGVEAAVDRETLQLRITSVTVAGKWRMLAE